MPYDDERIDPNLNSDKKSQSDSSNSFVPGGYVNTTNFPNISRNDVDSSEDIFTTQDEQVTTLEDNIFSEGNLNQNPSTSTQDVNNAFLYDDLAETVYMKPPEGNVFLALLVYVDDIIITGNNVSEIDKFKVFLKSNFMIKDLGKLKYFTGIEVIDTVKGICLNQRKYVLGLLSDYSMLACKPAKTPLISKLVISNKAFDDDHILDNIIDYQKLMGKLIYLTNTRPDISYVVHCLSQFMHSLLKSHLKIAFKIFRYLTSYPGLGIHFSKSFSMDLKGFSHDDWLNMLS
nr:ribonuclease H-like domain-containing protein [Tanacetum cinerariifolium]